MANTAVPMDEDNRGSKRRRVQEDGKDVIPKCALTTTDGDPAAASVTAGNGVPPSVWARALSAYLPYEDVRSCSASCRFFAEEVAPLVDCLYVFRSAELRMAPARRYAAVEEIYVYSLNTVDVENSDEQAFEMQGLRSFSMDAKTASRVVHFLASFQRLKYVFLGGYDMNDDAPGCQSHRQGTEIRTDFPYWNCYCTTENHEEIYRGLVRSFCGAYYSGALSHNVRVEGILSSCYDQQTCSAVETGEDDARGVPLVRTDPACEFCREICSTFPMRLVFNLGQRQHQFNTGFLCISDRDRFSILAQRPKGCAFLQSKETALRLLVGYRTQMRRSGTIWSYPFLCRQSMDTIKLLCEEYDLNAKQIDDRSIFRSLFRYALNDDGSVRERIIARGEVLCITQQMRDWLENLGFKLPSDIRVLDQDGSWKDEYT